MSCNTKYKKRFILKLLNKACDHNGGVINTNRIAKPLSDCQRLPSYS